jgi:parvulin-like peptidyl-prolyl isomerase
MNTVSSFKRAFIFASAIIMVSQASRAFPPMPGSIYDPDTEYAKLGEPVPELPAGTIALVGGKPVKESDFMKWLGSKLNTGETFSAYIDEVLMEQKAKKLGITPGSKELDSAVEARVDEDMKPYAGRSIGKQDEERLRAGARARYAQYLVPALIIYREWKIPDEEIRKRFQDESKGNPSARFSEAARKEIRKKIALETAEREPDKLRDRLMKEAKVSDLKEGAGDRKKELLITVNGRNIRREDFARWFALKYGSGTRVLETYIARMLIEARAKELGILVSGEDLRAARDAKIKEMQERMADPSRSGALEDEELLTDMYASRILFAQGRKVTDGEITARFEKEYGWKGRKYGMKQIFKKVEKKYLDRSDPAYKKGAEELNAAARKRIERIYEKLKKEGPDSFRIIAQQESDDGKLRDIGGYMGEFNGAGGNDSINEAVRNLNEGEISGILETEEGFHIIKIDSKKSGKTYVSRITVSKTPGLVLDRAQYNRDRKAARKQLEKVLKKLKKGYDFQTAASEYSDDYAANGCDISKTWEKRYGGSFGEQVMQIDGDTGIVESPEGLHIVKLEDFDITDLTPALRRRLDAEIRSEILPTQELVALAVRLMREAKVYYKQ